MKKRGLIWMLSWSFLMVGMISVSAQQYTVQRDAEVPGDNFSLEGALELFKKSSSPEEFEKMLNSPDARVNNLDLNADGYVDYIRVLSRKEGHVHIFIMQAVIDADEFQDIAVISLEKLANGKAVLQITGDEDIYGIETIIEPTEEVYVNAGTTSTRTVVNVWTWPVVRYIYSPSYVVYVSPWRWTYRPVWYHTWRPVAYYVYDPWWRPYRSYYTVCHSHRIVYAPRIYRPYRTTSVIVYNRHHKQINHYRSTHRDYHNGRDRYDNRSRYDGRSYYNNERRRSEYGQHQQNTPGRNWDPKKREDVKRSIQPTRDNFSNRWTSEERNKPSVTPQRSKEPQRFNQPERKPVVTPTTERKPFTYQNNSEMNRPNTPATQRHTPANRSLNDNRMNRQSSGLPQTQRMPERKPSSGNSVTPGRSNTSSGVSPKRSTAPSSPGHSGVQRSGGSKSYGGQEKSNSTQRRGR